MGRAGILKGMAVAGTSFLALGTVAALWENPIFIRMIPAGTVEITLLALMSALIGLYVAIRRPSCSVRTAGTGSVLGFLGIACPTCNQILMLAFGGEMLLTYFEPVRIYVGAAGSLILAVAVAHEWRRGQAAPAAHDAGPA